MSYLDSCSDVLSDLRGHLGLSEALLEPSWAILDASATCETRRPGPGEGVGGGVNPSSKGKKGIGKGISLNHSRPRGLVGVRACTYLCLVVHPSPQPEPILVVSNERVGFETYGSLLFGYGPASTPYVGIQCR